MVYRQPVTRVQIEELRCVDCGAVLRTLLERGLVRIVGRRDAPGRPVLYGSTSRFLETFSLESLADLPPLPEIATEEAYAGTPADAAAADASDRAPEEAADGESIAAAPADDVEAGHEAAAHSAAAPHELRESGADTA